MKNVLLGINILLILAVGYLYYLHFSAKSSPVSAPPVSNQTAVVPGGSTEIAYIDLDSLQSKYDFYQKIKADVDKKTNSANNEIMALQKKFQARASELQQKSTTMTPQQQEMAMNEINKMQQDFQVRKQNLDNELFDYNSKMKEQIISRIESFLKDFNKDHKYSYIFSYEPGFMFFKDSALNITTQVVDGLNAEFKKETK
ncbi:MAG: OmpH family outer membrane protein [Chitinophagaceae bacterium]|nr:OmpH family outer membrane protein [Chitinophagaceae bacterium]